MEVHRTPLPGIGLRHEFVTERGRRVGVISHRSGRRGWWSTTVKIRIPRR